MTITKYQLTKTPHIKHICPGRSSQTCSAGHLDCYFCPMHYFHSVFIPVALALIFQECSCDTDPPPTILSKVGGCSPVAFAVISDDSPMVKNHTFLRIQVSYTHFTVLLRYSIPIVPDKALSNHKTSNR